MSVGILFTKWGFQGEKRILLPFTLYHLQSRRVVLFRSNLLVPSFNSNSSLLTCSRTSGDSELERILSSI